MPRLIASNPKYRKHRASGQAVLTLNGRDLYLGPHGTKSSRAEYDRLIGEWLQSGRRPRGAGVVCDLAVTEFVAAFWKHAQTYYAGPHQGERMAFKAALHHLNRLYGPTAAAEFGPLSLKTIRQAMIDVGWCRRYVNRQVGRIKRAFRWGVEQEIVPATVYHALQAVEGLRAGRSSAKESEPVRPVPDAYVRATLPHVSRQVRAMIELQLVTGMRPGEVTTMRGCDVDTTGRLWTYTPSSHKTAHHGHSRTVYLGPRAQEILGPFLKPDVSAYLFSPSEAEQERRGALHAARKTPMSCGNKPGTNRRRRPKKLPGERYGVDTYRRAIQYAAAKANRLAHEADPSIPPEQEIVPSWHPHQLRHNAATLLRKQYGLEAAQVILGHRSLSVTEVYAERNVAAAQKIMAEVG